MSFIFKFFACCQSSKNIEHEKENQEIRLSSPRFGHAIPQNVYGNHNFSHIPENTPNDNSQNDQTFQGNGSFRLDSPADRDEENNNNDHPNNVSFENIKDHADNNISKSDEEDQENQDKDNGKDKQPQQEYQSVSLSRFDPEKKSRFAAESKEFKKSKTLGKKDKSNNEENKTTVGGFLVMNKIKRDDETKTKDPVALANAKSREILNSTPILRPQKNP